jgi:putative flippase GtrA
MSRAPAAFLKFIASGAFNTAFTYLVYLVLLEWLPYRWSFSLSYAMGILLAYLLYRYFVFGNSGGRYGPLWVVLIYLGQYLLGLGLVSLWVEAFKAPAVWGPAFSIAILVPITYVLNHRVFRPRRNHAQRGANCN